MRPVLQALSVTLVGLALVPALAHVLELPGKLRLPQQIYAQVQTIYYPGFTIAGFAPAAILATLVLAFFTSGSALGPADQQALARAAEAGERRRDLFWPGWNDVRGLAIAA
jgi:hypothetical protein